MKDAPAAEGSTTDAVDGNSTPSVNTAVNPASSNLSTGDSAVVALKVNAHSKSGKHESRYLLVGGES